MSNIVKKTIAWVIAIPILTYLFIMALPAFFFLGVCYLIYWALLVITE